MVSVKRGAIICDLDGTLALFKESDHRGPFDWQKVDQDKLNMPIAVILDLFLEAGWRILLFSGRDSCCRKKTEQWLKDHSVKYDLLYMRPEGDMRPDTEVKLEMYNRIKDLYRVFFVLDDRDSVVKQWRELGLTCLQVAEGNF